MVNVVIFYDHLEYFTAIWYNLWPFGIVGGHLLYFSQFGMFGPRKIWQPWRTVLVAKNIGIRSKFEDFFSSRTIANLS
jgi:hypothetical protein